MSTTHRPAQTPRPATAQPTDRTASTPSAGADRPTATYPTHPLATAYPLPEGWRIDPAGYLPGLTEGGDPAAAAAAAARLKEADATPTVTLPAEATTRAALFPAIGPLCGRPADAAFIARAGARGRARVYHTAFPAVDDEATERGAERGTGRRERTERRERRRQARRRHLRAALTAIALAAALLTGMQLYAAAGISSARQAALAARNEGAAPAAATSATSATSETYSKHARNRQDAPRTKQPAAPSQPPLSGQTAAWVTQDTHVPYSKDDAAATPLDLPRCTTAPDTPMPCLAHLHTSPSGAPDRVVTLEEDGSMTAFVPR